MTSINIPKDDFAVREARSRNASTPAVQAPQETSPTKATEPVQPQQAVRPARTANVANSKQRYYWILETTVSGEKNPVVATT